MKFVYYTKTVYLFKKANQNKSFRVIWEPYKKGREREREREK
jgi:hypothetical protein